MGFSAMLRGAENWCLPNTGALTVQKKEVIILTSIDYFNKCRTICFYYNPKFKFDRNCPYFDQNWSETFQKEKRYET